MPESQDKTYFVTGGGTGGHIYPALAVADELSKDSKVIYVGNRHNMEYELATSKKYKFLHVGVSGMPRKLSLKLFIWLFKLIKSVLYSIKYIKKYKPSAVFATGGYVSAPMIIACIFTKTPYMMHDCDAMPGLVTRKLSRRANCVSLAFERAKKYIPNKNVIITGNPIRTAFKTMSKEEGKNSFGFDNTLTLAVMGGSQGAKSINNTVVELLKELIQDKHIQIIFQTGKKNYDEIIEKLNLIFPRWEQESSLVVKPYFMDMISVLKASDIVISRSGSLSLSEISASDTAPILVPYPYAAANHQRLNAKSFLDEGACIYIEDSSLEPNMLRDTLFSLIDNPVKINYLKQNSSHFAKYDSAEQIVNQLKNIS